MPKSKQQIEFGDWQTPPALARAICRRIQEAGIDPQVVIEPTCGKGHFLFAALEVFKGLQDALGVDINAQYLSQVQQKLQGANWPATVQLRQADSLRVDFSQVCARFQGKRILILGNPPWVTNSALGGMQSNNVPEKSNLKQEKGLDAITGKGNFDIAECITICLIEAFENAQASLVLIVKNQVIKNLLHLQKSKNYRFERIAQFEIDAKAEFGVDVAASVLWIDFGAPKTYQCQVSDFYTQRAKRRFGWHAECFVADLQHYESVQSMEGRCPFVWRSGVKHDCAKVMELTHKAGALFNGFKEQVDVESEVLFALVKSSGIAKIEQALGKRFVLITQQAMDADTAALKQTAPKAWRYLLAHSQWLDARKSAIYRNRPRFCLFGVGEYTFQKYKVAISGLYKTHHFALLGPYAGKPVVLDDTCYSIGFASFDDARIVQTVLNGALVQSFLSAICFGDSKRSINKEQLMRIDLKKMARTYSPSQLGLTNEEHRRFCALLK